MDARDGPGLDALKRREARGLRPPLVAQAQRLPENAREIAKSELVLCEELGHYSQVEDPEAIHRAVSAFWTRIEG